MVALDGIDHTDKAKELVGTSLYLPLHMLPPLKGNKFYFHEVVGFAVLDKKHGNIGEVETVLDFPQQAILQIKKGSDPFRIKTLAPRLKPQISQCQHAKFLNLNL